MYPNQTSGDLLKRCRLAMGFSQRKLARVVGVSSSAYSRYEKGERLPPKELMNNLAILLHGQPGDDLAELANRFLASLKWRR